MIRVEYHLRAQVKSGSVECSKDHEGIRLNAGTGGDEDAVMTFEEFCQVIDELNRLRHSWAQDIRQDAQREAES